MPRGKRFTAEEINGKLRDAGVELARGKTVPAVVRKLGATDRRLHRAAVFLPEGHDDASRLIEGVLAAAKTLPPLQFIEIPSAEDRTPPDVYWLKVAGALVWTHASGRWVLDLHDPGGTVVSCNTEWTTAGIPCVGVDLQASVERAVAHFWKLRRGHVAFVGHMTLNSPAKRRQRDAFVQLAQTQDWSTAVLDLAGIPSDERHRLVEPEREQGLITFSGISPGRRRCSATMTTWRRSYAESPPTSGSRFPPTWRCWAPST
ncbi:MAG: hypothetical protein FJ284_06170 [Planctomycetes bacterium]|nr:hypothetical protein [Planctomycetota bacterium]